MKKLLFVLSQAPDKALALEALDAVMTALLFEQDPYLIFIGEGVQQLEHADLARKINQLSELGLKNIYAKAAAQSVDQEQAYKTNVTLKTLSANETTTLLHQADKILSF